MSMVLKAYLDAERGRAARLADTLGISRSYISDLAAGKKTASVPLLRQIAEATGLGVDDIIGGAIPGMSEGHATAYQPGPRANRLRDMVGMLFPGLRHPSYYIADREQTAFAILAGDLLVTEANFTAERVENGQLVVASAFGEFGSGQTVIAKTARPWIIDAKGQICGEIGINASVLGLVQIVVRSADPAAF